MMPLLILWTVLVNPWFVQWWTGVDYYSGNPTNIALGLGAIFLIVNRAMQIMLLIKMSVKKMALITGAGAIMEILLYFLLIPRMGVLGVPTASCLANMLWTTPWMVRHALDGWGIQALFMHLKLAGALIASLMIAYFVGGYIGQTDGKPLQQFATAFTVGLIFSAVLCFRLWVLNKNQKAAGE
jgi:O-antigen/teichoic acid export membrane protein